MPAAHAGPFGRLPLPLLIATFCVLWSSAFAVAKLALADCPPLLLLTARFAIAGVATFGLVALQGVDWRLGRRDLFGLAGLGLANNAVYLGLNYVGMGTVSSGVTALIISANPVLTSLFAALLLGERMSWRKAAGLALGVGGVAYIVEARIGSGRSASFSWSADCCRLSREPSCSSAWRPAAGCWSETACRTSWPASPSPRSPSASKASATSCRAGGSWRRSPISPCSARCWAISSGST